MREAIKKLKNCFWGEYLIGTILFGLLTLSLIVLAVSSGIKLNNAKSEATEYFHCNEVVFCFNTDETSPEPLGYYIEARLFDTDGQMSKTYVLYKKAREWYFLEQKNNIITAITIPFGVFCGIMAAWELYFMIDGIIYVRKQNKRTEIHD